ncbi:MAG: RidA family protein [Deltaproteobacteria bacterium]|nr:RidA family protein [Deltaproteobacteria bacterium]
MDLISTDKAPAAIGPYSQAVKTGGLLFCSGQIGIDPSTGRLSGNDIKSQTKQVLNNLKAVLLASGLSLADVVKTTIFLVNMDDFSIVNEIYGMEFGDHKPARATVQAAGLPLDALVEIECMAEIKKA